MLYPYLLPPGDLFVGDYPRPEERPDPKPVRRTFYGYPIQKLPWPASITTTYYVRGNKFKLNDMHLGISSVTRMTYSEVSAVLYARKIHFHGSIQSALAFLHDCAHHLGDLKKISLRLFPDLETYAQQPAPAPEGTWTPPTPMNLWRKFLNVMIHNCPGIEKVELFVDKTIWNVAPWKKGISTVMERPDDKPLVIDFGCAEDNGPRKSYLQHVARFHNGCKFTLTIDEPEGYCQISPEMRVKYRKALEECTEQEMADRPRFDTKCRCSCMQDNLKHLVLDWSCILRWE
ncbi:uncharacterized protein BDZ99DRAFT_513468 [Mytilinidion resinicola]|uniref:Uncharacterized protein n=1 Tax=Mytilinidion resinicola TaxID=574789 RepID=A0A6A6ZAA5_9PEZI|nr:uncharacterized protein BDZ99DRAFT_513468 [Mytilinidion resinicola]KAF2817224.1 hypothetical protein BDZ99DRAFT_513468 [Mytilinidion resinicola]